MKYFWYGLIFVLFLNFMLFAMQMVVTDVATTNGEVNNVTFYTVSGSLLNRGNAGNYTTPGNFTDGLPTSAGQVTQSDQGFFVDSITTAKNWLASTTVGSTVLTGLAIADGVINAVPNSLRMLNQVGVPNWFTWALSAAWYIALTFLIAALIMGWG